jgi:hypothetical protein
MRTTFVMVTLLLALALGVVAALLDSRLFVGIVTIGIIPMIWGASDLIERLTGHDLWRFSTPSGRELFGRTPGRLRSSTSRDAD